ncbi:hypothetical protein HYH02_012178 [Chlamydomonas schloesseri]|uniref:Uncharacterized protein n=1 Tax=Chlamydomonas schloesseri TaxID=2026947 RepID=A0A835TAB7_9CHLO|nr:hypothetical protein HYH02_012178 [Chlamydomonas schloesseri]|eukprot:KAG2434511.1 hypothetical protein HYH02_012178 [Chlamydomonas schloesseri]
MVPLTLPCAALGQLPHARPRHVLAGARQSARTRKLPCHAASTLGASDSNPAAGGKTTSSKDAPRAAADVPADSGRGAPSAADDGAASSSGGGSAGTSSSTRAFVSSPALVRRLAAASTVEDVTEALSEEAAPSGLSEEDARAVLAFCLQRGKTALALGIYREMCLARRGGSRPGAAGRSLDVAFAWPAAGLATTTELVLGLSQQLCIVEALQVLSDIKVQGLPRGSEEVGFGKVVTSPLAPDRPLTVVQPQEGAKTVADGYSRYEFDVFTGTCLGMSSTALNGGGNLLLGLGRVLGLVKKPAVAAIHEFVLQAPDNTSRTFRVGTDTASVPAQVGERLTVVSSPVRNVRQGGLFNASPPGTRPGEALAATNHKTGTVLQLLRPPASAEQAGSLPSWVLPVAVVLAGGDAASSLLDPALPLLLAAGATSLAGGSIVTNSVVVPKLKQLPDNKVKVEYVRQQLLGQYSTLAGKAAAVLAESAEDVRFLARLWQLQNKMEAVGAGAAPSTVAAAAAAAAAASGSASGSSSAGASNGSGASSSSGSGGQGAASAYEARIGRVSRARANIEERLARKVELLDGYSRVMNMIEIEVEMDIEVPAAEVAGIQQQMDRLIELESVAEDWRAQAEARDEVERLLRAA